MTHCSACLDCLVGYTGFVGSNLMTQHKFDKVYNSKNIEEAYGLKPDLLVYTGVRAEMFLANQNPDSDLANIKQAISNIENINAAKVVLISTVAVYDKTDNVDENKNIDESKLSAYGANRLILERWLQENYNNCNNRNNYKQSLIVRLPAIYGYNLKKNFIYDYIHKIPSLLKEDKFEELVNKESSISSYYVRQDNGFYKCKELNADEKDNLIEILQSLGFTALNFTDSRSVYQFYPLSRLWQDIQTALDNNLILVNFVTPPMNVSELYNALTGEIFINTINKNPYKYDIRTLYSRLFCDNNDGYIMSKEEELANIKNFIRQWEQK